MDSMFQPSFYPEEQRRMVQWLDDTSTIVMHAAAIQLNWDFSIDVILWIARQPRIDRATASALFFLSCPSNVHPYRSTPDSPVVDYRKPENEDWKYDASYLVGKTISQLWNVDAYSKGLVALNHDNNVSPYFRKHPDVDMYLRAQIEFGPLGRMPWPEMKGIEGPFDGETPRPVLDYVRQDQDAYYLVTALFQDLGMNFGEVDTSSDCKYIDWREKNGFGEEGHRGDRKL